MTRPRPGHADLSSGLKYEREDLRDILERASARETAARVAAGSVARALLRQFGVDVTSHVWRIGPAALDDPGAVSFLQARALAADDDTRCVDGAVAAAMRTAVDEAKAAGDTLGGAFEVIVQRASTRPRQSHPVGPEARRTAGAGDHVDSGDQGRWHRSRRRGSRSPGLARA